MKNLSIPIVSAIAAAALVNIVVFAFTEPTAPPPTENVSAPLNVGTGRQTKLGDIGLNNLTANSITLGGDTRTTWPGGGVAGLPDRLYGQGRPNAGVIDARGECTVGGLRVSRSDRAVSWGEAPAACPAGWWVCTATERGGGACKISGFGDDAAGRLRGADCDTTEDSGSVQDSDGGYTQINTFSAWVSDAATGTGSSRQRGVSVRADDGNEGNPTNCSILPVWCCTN